MRAGCVSVVLLALSAGVVAGCAPTVGRRESAACDLDLARTVVYTRAGRPAYLGQALLIQSCGGLTGACHSPVALDRYGVPFGLDFAAFPVTSDDDGALMRLASIQDTIHRNRNLIWRDVLDGSMPPGGVGAEVMPDPLQGYSFWVLGDDPQPADPIPGLDTDEGREALRNWLACGSPVVERYVALDAVLCTVDEDCPVTGVCEAPWCASVGDAVPALDVRFDDINFATLWSDILRPACAAGVACHGRSPSADFDLSTLAIARSEVMEATAPNSPATGAVCGESPFMERVVPGDPDASLLYHKVAPGPLCGQRMPFTTGGGGVELTDNEIAAVRLWILCIADPAPEACCVGRGIDVACCSASPPVHCPPPIE